jgi:hypothetical protein
VLADLTQSRAAAAYAALVEIERLAALLASAPALTDRIAIAEVITQRHARFRDVLDRLAARDSQPETASASPALDDARRRVAPTDWWEGLAAVALFAPLTDELFIALAGAGDQPSVDGASAMSEVGGRADASAAYSASDAAAIWAAERLRSAIGGDPVLAARMALWGRRLVGEAIVLARAFGGERYRELAEQLAARHALRLDELGLAG